MVTIVHIDTNTDKDKLIKDVFENIDTGMEVKKILLTKQNKKQQY